jgi:hypothetical protein
LNGNAIMARASQSLPDIIPNNGIADGEAGASDEQSRLSGSGQLPRGRLENSRVQTVIAALIFLALTAAAALPVITDLDNVIAGDDADTKINLWADWWTLRALQDPNESLFKTDYMFYPRGTDLSFHSFRHLNTGVSLALRPLIGVMPAYNLAILLNFVLSGIAMFQLCRYLTRSSVAGILAGIVFAFNSHSQYQSAHPVLVSIWCFPWATLYLMRAVRENNAKFALLASLFVVLGAASSTLLLILMALWLAMLTGYMFISSDWPRPPWRLLLTLGVFSLMLTLPLVFPLLREAFSNGNGSFLMDPSDSIRMDVLSIVIPHWYFWHVRGLYLGIVPAYFGMLAVHNRRREVRLWALLLITSFLFAIGPTLEILGHKSNILLPWTLPVIPLLRNTYRFNILLGFALAVLAANGWVVVSGLIRDRRVRYAVAFIVLAATYIDFTAAPFPVTPINVSPFYTDYLQDAPPELALAVLPNGRQEGKWHMFYQTIHGRKITGGTVSRASEETFSYYRGHKLLRMAERDGEEYAFPADIPAHLETLARDGIGYIVLDKNLMEVHGWRHSMPVSPVYEDDQVLAYSTSRPPSFQRP